MMHIPEHEKAGRRTALKTLLDKMKGLNSDKLAGLKKKAVAPGEAAASEESMEPAGDDAAEEGGGFCSHCGKAR